MPAAQLEEDGDCAVYLEAYFERTQVRPIIQEEYREHFSRSQPRFGHPQFCPEFWEKLRS